MSQALPASPSKELQELAEIERDKEDCKLNISRYDETIQKRKPKLSQAVADNKIEHAEALLMNIRFDIQAQRDLDGTIMNSWKRQFALLSLSPDGTLSLEAAVERAMEYAKQLSADLRIDASIINISLQSVDDHPALMTAISQFRHEARERAEALEGIVQKLTEEKEKYRQFTWTPKVPSCNIDEGSLYFVNRDEAVNDLVNLLTQNRIKAHAGTSNEGEEFQIGLIDNLIGMGKTCFGGNFVYQCSQLPPEHPSKTDASLLSQARTLHLDFQNLAFAGISAAGDKKQITKAFETSVMKVLFDRLEVELGKEFVSVLKSDLSKIPIEDVNSSKVWKEVMERTGGKPIFVVLDEVGKAFEGARPENIHSIDECVDPSTVKARRYDFIKLCDYVLTSWIKTEDLYFVVMGRGDIFDWVGHRPNDNPVPGSPFEFVRLPLSMIRENKIVTILERTTRGLRGYDGQIETVPLKRFFSFAEGDLTKYASIILKATNGHPRAMCTMLRKCKTKEELEKYQPVFKLDNEWFDSLVPYRVPISRLLGFVVKRDAGRENNPEPIRLFNLSERIAPNDDRNTLTYNDIADRAQFRWEGELIEATLYVSPPVERALGILCYEFDQFLSLYTSESGRLYPKDRVFEYLLMKRLQDLFKAEISPRDCLPAWFGDTPFGEVGPFKVSSEIVEFPKVTRQSNADNDPSLYNATVHPHQVSRLMAKLLDQGSGCFLPLPQSSSCDGFFVSRSGQKNIVVSIAAKCVTEALSFPDIDKEVANFNKMFSAADREEPETVTEAATPSKRARFPMRERTTILLVVSTGGFSETESHGTRMNGVFPRAAEFEFKKEENPNVDHVILVNLEEKDMREEFFNIKGKADLCNNLEYLVKLDNL